jgi:hypothetical protein
MIINFFPAERDSVSRGKPHRRVPDYDGVANFLCLFPAGGCGLYPDDGNAEAVGGNPR